MLPLHPPPLKLFICLCLSLLSFCLSFYCSLSLISPQFATSLLFPFAFILLFYILTPRSLCCRLYLTPVSNVCEAVLRSLVGAPNWLNKLAEVRFKFPFNLIGKSTMAFFNRPIMTRARILVHSWGPRTRISALFHRRS